MIAAPEEGLQDGMGSATLFYGMSLTAEPGGDSAMTSNVVSEEVHASSKASTRPFFRRSVLARVFAPDAVVRQFVFRYECRDGCYKRSNNDDTAR
jgi:hypothetical protein